MSDKIKYTIDYTLTKKVRKFIFSKKEKSEVKSITFTINEKDMAPDTVAKFIESEDSEFNPDNTSFSIENFNSEHAKETVKKTDYTVQAFDFKRATHKERLIWESETKESILKTLRNSIKDKYVALRGYDTIYEQGHFWESVDANIVKYLSIHPEFLMERGFDVEIITVPPKKMTNYGKQGHPVAPIEYEVPEYRAVKITWDKELEATNSLNGVVPEDN